MSVPIWLPFDITITTGEYKQQQTRVAPDDLLIYSMASKAAHDLGEELLLYYDAQFQFYNLDTNYKLFDTLANIRTVLADARTPVRFPTPWFIQRGEQIVMDAEVLIPSAYNSVQLVLAGRRLQAGEPRPSLKVQPQFLSFELNKGWGYDVAIASYQASRPEGAWNWGGQSKVLTEGDFELYGILIDEGPRSYPFSEKGPFSAINIFNPVTKRSLWSTPVLSSLAAGKIAWESEGITLPTIFPSGNAMPYWLSSPVTFEQGTHIQVIAEQSSLFVNSAVLSGGIYSPTNTQQFINVVLIGNRVMKS